MEYLAIRLIEASIVDREGWDIVEGGGIWPTHWGGAIRCRRTCTSVVFFYLHSLLHIATLHISAQGTDGLSSPPKDYRAVFHKIPRHLMFRESFTGINFYRLRTGFEPRYKSTPDLVGLPAIQLDHSPGLMTKEIYGIISVL